MIVSVFSHFPIELCHYVTFDEQHISRRSLHVIRIFVRHMNKTKLLFKHVYGIGIVTSSNQIGGFMRKAI